MVVIYGEPVCTPSRAALMTGRYPMRHGLQTRVIFPSHTFGLPTDERTLPQALKAAGYQTYMVGKWHLGHADKKYWPQNRGFDHFYGNVMGEVDYFTKDRGGVIDWQRNGKFLKEPGYYTTLIGNEAVKLDESHRVSHQAADPSVTIGEGLNVIQPVMRGSHGDDATALAKLSQALCGGAARAQRIRLTALTSRVESRGRRCDQKDNTSRGKPPGIPLERGFPNKRRVVPDPCQSLGQSVDEKAIVYNIPYHTSPRTIPRRCRFD